MTSDKTIFFRKFNGLNDEKPTVVNLARVTAIQPGHRDGITIFYFGSESEEEGTYVEADFDDICKFLEIA